MKGKNGEIKGRAVAIKIPTHVALQIFSVLSCGAATGTDEVPKSPLASQLAVIESEPDLLIVLDLASQHQRLMWVDNTRVVLRYGRSLAGDVGASQRIMVAPGKV